MAFFFGEKESEETEKDRMVPAIIWFGNYNERSSKIININNYYYRFTYILRKDVSENYNSQEAPTFCCSLSKHLASKEVSRNPN